MSGSYEFRVVKPMRLLDRIIPVGAIIRLQIDAGGLLNIEIIKGAAWK